MLIDDFRIRRMCLNNKVKGHLSNFLVWLLSKIDGPRLKKCNIDRKVEVETSQYIPDDGKWHQFAWTTEFWIKLDESKEVFSEKIYVDGKEKE